MIVRVPLFSWLKEGLCTGVSSLYSGSGSVFPLDNFKRELI